jgi:hypothetical protein
MTDGPYDYARERDDAENADAWRYPPPGRWVAGEWRTPDREELTDE